LYIAQDRTGRFQKISLHASGRFRLAFHENYHQGLVDGGIVDPSVNRAITVWDRPAGNGKAAQLAVSILLPSTDYRIPLNEAEFTKATSLFKIEPGNALEIGIFLSERHSDDLEQKLAKVGIPVWYADLGGAGTSSVVIRQVTFDRTEFVSKLPVTLPARSIHEPAEMPTDQAPVKTGLGALLFNDATTAGMLRVVELSGITLSKTRKD
jgi:hypothetical protein